MDYFYVPWNFQIYSIYGCGDIWQNIMVFKHPTMFKHWTCDSRVQIGTVPIWFQYIFLLLGKGSVVGTAAQWPCEALSENKPSLVHAERSWFLRRAGWHVTVTRAACQWLDACLQLAWRRWRQLAPPRRRWQFSSQLIPGTNVVKDHPWITMKTPCVLFNLQALKPTWSHRRAYGHRLSDWADGCRCDILHGWHRYSSLLGLQSCIDERVRISSVLSEKTEWSSTGSANRAGFEYVPPYIGDVGDFGSYSTFPCIIKTAHLKFHNSMIL